MPRGRQRTDSTHVLGAVRALNRLECVIETLRAALTVLAVTAPAWRRTHVDPAWAERYAKPADDFHLPPSEAARQACAAAIGRDEPALLAAVTAPDAPIWLGEVPVWRCVWLQNCYPASATATGGDGADAAAGDGAVIRWRTTAEGFPNSLRMIASPYDLDVHSAKKRSTTWIGDKVHLTETCDTGRPHLITYGETVPAPVVDRDALDSVHTALSTTALLPATHLVDAGYLDADQVIISRRDYAIALLGPVPEDQQWQARTEGAFTIQDFRRDWDQQIATCPAGHASHSWTADHNQGRTVMRIRFASTDCKPCPLNSRCARSARRLLTRRREETRCCKPPEPAKQRRQRLWRRATNVPASKAPYRRACGPCPCAAHAILASPKRIFSTC